MVSNSFSSSLKKNHSQISQWFEKHEKKIYVPFLTSVTIKDSGFKASVSDVQIFPSGLNYLCKTDLKNVSRLIRKYFERHYPEVLKNKNILILSSANNPNPFYYDHLEILCQLMKKGGFKPQIATLNTVSGPISIKTPAGKRISIHPVYIEKDRLKTAGVDPSFIVAADIYSATTLSSFPYIRQPISPPFKAFSNHEIGNSYLSTFNKLVEDFSRILSEDPWLLGTDFELEHRVNIDDKGGLEKIALTAATLLTNLKNKYSRYQIASPPSLTIRSNSGTSGTGIVTIRSTEDLLQLHNYKKQKKSATKNQMIDDILIKEEIQVRPLFKEIIGETVIYLIGNKVAGGYIKTYCNKMAKDLSSARKNLFQSVCLTGKIHRHPKKRTDKKFGVVYHNLSKIGGLAVGYTIDQIRA